MCSAPNGFSVAQTSSQMVEQLCLVRVRVRVKGEGEGEG